MARAPSDRKDESQEKSERFDPRTVQKVGDAGPQRSAPHGADVDERDRASPLGDVYKAGDAGPPRPSLEGHRADADERDETLSLGSPYKIGDAGPQRPSDRRRRADADERA